METLINNMKKKSMFIILVFMILFSFAFVSAQPPFQTSAIADKSILIESPVIETITANQDFSFHAHLHNSSDGRLLPYSSIDFCLIHIYSPEDGDHLIETNMSKNVNGIDWEYKVLGGNFTEINKQYAGYIYCQTNTTGDLRGGYFEFGFDVTKNGTLLNSSESLIYFILAFGVLLLFGLSFFFMIYTPYANEVNEKGAIIKITKLKYVKLALILLTWVLFTWLLNILIGLSDNFVSLTMYYGFFGFMFDIMNSLALPLGIVIFVISIFEIVRDANIMGNIKKFGSAYK